MPNSQSEQAPGANGSPVKDLLKEALERVGKPADAEKAKKRFKRLLDLPGWAGFEAKLRGGGAALAMAKEIKAAGLLADMSEDAIRKRLKAFLKAVPAEAVAVPVKPRAGIRVSEGLSNLVTLDKMVRLQTKRIEEARKFEKALQGMPLPSMGKEIELIMRLCQARLEVQQELGLVKKVPTRIGLDVSGDVSHRHAHVLQVVSTPDGRSRVLEASRRFVELVLKPMQREGKVTFELPGARPMIPDNGGGGDVAESESPAE